MTKIILPEGPAKMEQDLIELLKSECANEINKMRNEFCSHLMAFGLGPEKVKLQEHFEKGEGDKLVYGCIAVYRDTGEAINMEDYQKNFKPVPMEENQEFQAWLVQQNSSIQKVVQKYPPDKLYTHPSTHYPMRIIDYTYNMDEYRVEIKGMINHMVNGMQTLDGIEPELLEEFVPLTFN